MVKWTDECRRADIDFMWENDGAQRIVDDEIIEEIRAVRKKIAEECDYDFDKLGERLMRLQEQHPELLVYEVPKTEPVETSANEQNQ